MKGRNDLLVILGLFGGLLVVTFLLATMAGAGSAREKSFSVHSTGKQGTSALAQWARELGLRTRNLESVPFEPDVGLRAMFVINPSRAFAYTRAEAESVIRWVEDGHTLVYATDGEVYEVLGRMLDLSLGEARRAGEAVEPSQPLLIYPATGAVEMRNRVAIEAHPEEVAYLGAPGEALVVAKDIGEGRVYALAGAFPLTNEGLGKAGNAKLALNLLQAVPVGGMVGFDEYHHGYAQSQSFLALFYGSPWGWAVVYATGVLLIYLLLRGQRFARVLPGAVGGRRTMAEYVHSMAGMYRRAAQRPAILRQYVEESKQELGRVYGISPGLDNREFAARLAGVCQVDAKMVEELWSAPGRRKLREKEFVVLAARIEKLKEELSRDRRRSQPARR